MTSVSAPNVHLPKSPITPARRAEPDIQAVFTFAPLVSVAPLQTEFPRSATAGQPPIQGEEADTEPGKSDGPKAESAPLDAQGGLLVSATTLAERRLSERHGVEKPNEVNLAGRAAAELSSPRDPLGLIPSTRPPAGAQSSKAPDAAVGAGGVNRHENSATSTPHADPRSKGPANENAEMKRAMPGPPGATPDVARSAPPARNDSSAAAAAPDPARSARVSGITAVKAVGAASPVRSADGPGPAERAGPSPRERMWQQLERLGSRPARPASEGASRPATSREAETPARLEAQIARGLAAALRQREGRVTIRLTPELLGKLRVDLEISADRITAQIAASTDQARRLLEDNVVSLRTALEATGLGVERIEVVGTPAEPASQPSPAAARNDSAGHPGARQHGRDSHPGPGARGPGGAPHGGGDRATQSAEAEDDIGGAEYILRIDFLA